MHLPIPLNIARVRALLQAGLAKQVDEQVKSERLAALQQLLDVSNLPLIKLWGMTMPVYLLKNKVAESGK